MNSLNDYDERTLFFYIIMDLSGQIQTALGGTVDKVHCEGAKEHFSGKVRESFLLKDNQRAIVVSDRVSAFDYVLGTIPFKGQVLNQLSVWWFNKMTEQGMLHHFISQPDPNISLVKNADVLPIEIIVRAYLTGSTKTSSWYAYQNLDRQICGLTMPEGMKKNEKFPELLITPTTKPETGHDEPISRAEIITQGLVPEAVYSQAEELALKLFKFGEEVATSQGLILVDTKYEMGLDKDGNLILVDEVHTPDSSRYWIADTYEARLAAGEEPDSLDKEFVRRMVVANGYDVDSDEDPKVYFTDEIRSQAAQKYLDLYERMTGEALVLPDNLNARERIEEALRGLV